jgi:protein-S-isoprenylcysteine O-methyltransferase Ste14
LAYPAYIHITPEVHNFLCPFPDTHIDTAGLQALPSTFILGLFLSLSGGALRIWCYAVLGRLFTYEVTLQPSHTLVRAAPYSIVRHPSYTGLFMHFTGVALMSLSTGGWIRECGIIHSHKAGPWIIIWITLSAYTFVCVWKRGRIEDQLMKQRFGALWETYAGDVPWKFFPLIV